MKVRFYFVFLVFFGFGLSGSYAHYPSSQFIKVNGIPLRFKLFSLSAMPGDSLIFDQIPNPAAFQLYLADSLLQTDTTGKKITWKVPPNPGIYELIVRTVFDTNILKIMVRKPLVEIRNESSHFIVGDYPLTIYKSLNQYNIPDGMIEVTLENRQTSVSEHFKLEDFLTRQQAGFPQYVIISPKLIFKLELLIEKMNSKGIDVENLHVMSGYRTPYYNGSIGNGKNSRHVYGDAADIYLDNDRNMAMDDLNGDGTIDMKDVRQLASFIDEIDADAENDWLAGGIGIYKSNGSHRGFVHLDTRGFKVSW